MAKIQLLLLSPTEHELQRLLSNTTSANPDSLADSPANTPAYLANYRISSLCESNGVDVIARTTKGLVGYQRKTLADLKSSIIDGRLYKELAQMSTSRLLAYQFVIVEHDLRKTTVNGDFLDVDFPYKNYLSILTKFQLLGIGYYQSTSLSNTVEVIINTANYISSSSATDLRRVGSSKDAWGNSTNRDYMEFLVQSFPGVGPKLAKAIVSYFGGQLPMIWTIDERELLNIPGIGPSLAHKLYSFFNSEELTLVKE